MGRVKKDYIIGPGHMTKMATIIYGKTFKIFFSRTRSLMIFKLGMKDSNLACILRVYKVCILVDLDQFNGNVKFGQICFLCLY